MRIRVFVCLCAIALLSGGAALALTDTDTLTVTATVISSAQITAVGNIAFGNYDTVNAVPTDAAGSVSVQATTALSYTIYIGADRTMTFGVNNLLYELYSDATRTSIWGSALATGMGYISASTVEVTYPIYGRIAALQDVPAGGYTDTVTITLEW